MVVTPHTVVQNAPADHPPCAGTARTPENTGGAGRSGETGVAVPRPSDYLPYRGEPQHTDPGVTDERAPRSDAQRNRERILDAASAVLAAEPEATLAQVIEASGLSRATVYRHFADMTAVRTALLASVRREGRASLDEHFFDPGLSRGRPAQSTAEVLGAYLRKAFRMDSTYGHVLGSEREPGAELIEEFLPITLAMIRQGQERGEFRTDVDVTLTAKTYLTIVISAARRSRTEGFAIDDAVVMVETFLRGLERSPRPIWPDED